SRARSTAGPATSGCASTTCGRVSPAGATPRTTPAPAPTASRKPSRATRWPPTERTGAPTPSRRSGGAWTTSRGATRPLAAPGRTSSTSAGTDMARLLGPTDIRHLAASLGAMPTKKWGQNFVVDAGTVRRIARVAGVGPGDTVLEIGPGLGSLTLALLETGADVTAVEIDPRLAAPLPRPIAARAPQHA